MATASATHTYEVRDTNSSTQHADVHTTHERSHDIETVALVVTEPKADFKLQSIILDEIREDEVLVEMKYSGICHTDIVLQQGLLPMVEFPAIFGHEGAGFVRRIGSKVKNKSLRVGDPVLLSFNTCGTFNHNAVRLTDRSTPARMKDGKSVRSQYFGHSSFSKMSVVNEKCVVKCNYSDQMEIYAPIGCGFQTGAGTVLNVLKPGKDDSIVIFGLGSVGLTALMAAKHLDVGQIIAADIVQEKLQMAKELGATDTLNPKNHTNVAEAIKKVSSSGAGATFAIDCTGVLRVIEDMVACLAPQGTAAVVGVPPPDARISIDPLMFLLDNKKLIGVIEGDSNPEEFIPQLIRLHQEGSFPIEKLCRTYPVERLEDAIRDLHTGNVSAKLAMIPSQHPLPLPAIEDVDRILEAARTAAKLRYESSKYPYLSDAFKTMFANFLGWLRDGVVAPPQILIEAVQDERTILDIHNRLQAKALFNRKDARCISENIMNFPIRHSCVGWLQILLPRGSLKPIFQVDGYPHIGAAAQQARGGASEGTARPRSSNLVTSPNRPAGSSASNTTAGSGKVRDAPSPEHDFPDANFTLAEIAAFLPQSIKSWDIADRILWNGAGQEDIQKLMNKHRTMPIGKVNINSVYLMIRGQMRKRTQVEHDYEHWNMWVVGDQKDISKPHDYDPDSISVSGFRRPVIYKTRSNRAAEPIPFKDLANGISVWPKGYDALDLTRCVAWCADHPEEGYHYPIDYREVLARVGGPIQPSDGHTDAAVLARLRSGTGRTQARTRLMYNRILNKRGPCTSSNNVGSGTNYSTAQANKRRRKNLSSSTHRSKRTKTMHITSIATDTPKQAKRCSTVRRPSRALSFSHLVYDSEDDTEDEAYQGPRSFKKNKAEPRRSGRVKQVVNYGAFELESVGEEELECAKDGEDGYEEVSNGMDVRQ
ncbi:AreB protein [Stagonosporopsis vannaccii]|nr:AreB protein [Stagonosporopsis vannaccii]